MTSPTLGFLMVAATAQQAISQTGCLAWNGNQYCTQCDNANLYYQIGNGCVRYSGNACVAIDYLGRCINCQQGFYLAYGNTCQLVTYIVGCTLYATDTSTTVCRTCAAGYILVQNRCLQSVANCDQYIPGTNICARCALGYTQAADWCSCVPGNILNCIQYDCIGLCVLCNSTFPRLANNRASCLTWIPYCVVYQPTSNGCRICAAGYVLSSDGLTCTAGIPFCLTHQNYTTGSPLLCSVCQTNYYLSANSTLCVGMIPNCQTIDYVNLICSLCFPGWVPSDDGKVCLPAIPNCVRYQPSNALSQWLLCLVCATGYQPDPTFRMCVPICKNGFSVCTANNTCVAIPSCCELYDGCGACLTVASGWVWCRACQACIKIPPACLNNYDECGNCVCPTGQSWCSATNACVAIPSCCIAHDGCGNCITTTANFTWCEATKQCVAKPNCANYDNCGNCICNQPGFSLCAANKTCVAIPICCPTTSDGCGNCNSLLSNYTWCATTNYCAIKNTSCPNNNDGCGNCVCPSGQRWCQSSLSCVTSVTCPANAVSVNCNSCQCNPSGNSTVVYCAASNTCVAVPFCASTWDACGNVLTYQTGWGFCSATQRCYQIPTSCPTPAQHYCQNSTCICTSSQTWCAAQSRCFNVPSCCATNDGCGNCLTTIANTVFVNGVCYNKVTIPNCQTYDPTFQFCVTCLSPYVPNGAGSVCLPPLPKCLTYQTIGLNDQVRVCTQCQAPFVLNSGVCTIYLCVTHVYTLTTITCSQCQYPTLISPDATVCFEPIQFCTNYNLTGPIRANCLSCTLPYQLSATPMGVCQLKQVNLFAYQATGGYTVANAALFGFALSLTNQSLSWLAYNAANAASASWGWAWELSPLVGQSNIFSLRQLSMGVAPGASTPQLLQWYITVQNGSSVYSTIYQAQSASNNVAVVQQQWTIVPSANASGAVTIQNVSTGSYLGYGLNLSATPVNFYLNPI